MSDLAKRLRLDWTPIYGGCVGTMFDAADHIETQAARIAELEGALRGLDDRIVDLDAGHRELYQVSRFINAALEGKKDE
jgi:hypothetical protein